MRVDYCAERGIPYSQFMDWSEEDRAIVIAWMLHRNSKCQQCGTYPEEWMDEEGLPIEPAPWEIVSQKCLGCEIMDEEHSMIPDTVKGINLYFMRPGLVKRHDRSSFQQVHDPLEGGYG